MRDELCMKQVPAVPTSCLLQRFLEDSFSERLSLMLTLKDSPGRQWAQSPEQQHWSRE